MLLVEDSPDNQDSIGTILNAAGATVELANNGQEGLEMALHDAFSEYLTKPLNCADLIRALENFTL